MTASMHGPALPQYGSGGGYQPNYHYLTRDFQAEYEEEKRKAKHAKEVEEAARLAMEQSEFDSKVEQNKVAAKKLKEIAADLEFKITLADRAFMKMKMDALRHQQETDDEEQLLLLM
jgi:hypothetical protein